MSNTTPAEVFPPGEFIRDELEARGWTQGDLASILGRSMRLVNEIVMGKRGITPETAKGLAAAFGTPAQDWLNLQAAYNLAQVREGDDSIARRAVLYAKAPIKHLVGRHWIEPSENVEVLEKRILDFFDLDTLEQELKPQLHAARKSTPVHGETPAQIAWLQRARQLAAVVLAESYSPNRFLALVRDIKELLANAEDARQLPHLLAGYGVRLVTVEPFPRTKMDGACFWMNSKAPVIALSFRYDRLDYFWYTVAHELGHVKNQDAAMDWDLLERNGHMPDNKTDSDREADVFAAEMLIPQSELEDFITRVSPIYSGTRIRGFAALTGVHPGLVVGQLQYRGEIDYSQHRKFLVPVRSIVTESALTDGWGNTLPVAL